MMQGTWQDVENLEYLAQLNLKIASDALEDAIEHLTECRKRLEATLKLAREVADEEARN